MSVNKCVNDERRNVGTLSSYHEDDLSCWVQPRKNMKKKRRWVFLSPYSMRIFTIKRTRSKASLIFIYNQRENQGAALHIFIGRQKCCRFFFSKLQNRSNAMTKKKKKRTNERTVNAASRKIEKIWCVRTWNEGGGGYRIVYSDAYQIYSRRKKKENIIYKERENFVLFNSEDRNL